MTMEIDELYEKFRGFVESGDENGARAFVIEHINDFPEEARAAIVFEFFKDALAEQVQEDDALVAYKKHGTTMMEGIISTEKELENQARIIELQETLQK